MRAKHPELKTTPLFLWGMSAGGQFDYEFAAWKPERVGAFVVNKGGIYYSALVPRAAREVPGLLFIGGKDLESRIATITGLFAVNRRAGALWALTEEPSVGHAVARSAELGAMFFEDVMSLRLGADGALRPLAEKDGWYGDIHMKSISAVGTQKAPTAPTAWLPTERVAKAWLSVVTDTPFR
jgi:dienelactone hydrolase